eukprot:scaffold321357_cov48-Tisochrysis_lutea.AAC.2
MPWYGRRGAMQQGTSLPALRLGGVCLVANHQPSDPLDATEPTLISSISSISSISPSEEEASRVGAAVAGPGAVAADVLLDTGVSTGEPAAARASGVATGASIGNAPPAIREGLHVGRAMGEAE